MAPRGDIMQGTLDLIVLRTLETMGPLHGWGIAQRLEQVSEDAAARQPGHPLSRAAAAGAAGPHPLEVGHVREQPPRPVLQPDRQRTAAAAGRARRVASALRHRQSHARDGGLTCVRPGPGFADCFTRSAAAAATPSWMRSCASTSTCRPPRRSDTAARPLTRRVRPGCASAGRRRSKKPTATSRASPSPTPSCRTCATPPVGCAATPDSR